MNRSHSGRSCAWLLLAALWLAAAAAAAQDDPALASRPAAAVAVPAQAGTTPRPPLTPAEAEIEAIQAAGRAEVARLVAELATAPDDAARTELQRRIVETKRQSELGRLKALARQARERGDEPAAREATRLATLLREPARPAEPLLRQPEPQPSPTPSANDNAGGRR
jgi:hypothetical protein